MAIPANVAAVADDPNTDTDETVLLTNHDGSVEITFTLIGAVFNENVDSLMYDANTGDATVLPVAASAGVAQILSGGRKGDSTMVIKLGEGGIDGRVVSPTVAHSIYFDMPRLANLALGGVDTTDANPRNNIAHVLLHAAVTKRISGSFHGMGVPTERLSGTSDRRPYGVVATGRDSVTVAMDGDMTKNVVIDGDAAFMAIEGANSAGYVKLGTVTIDTQPIDPDTVVEGSGRDLIGYLQSDRDDCSKSDAEGATGCQAEADEDEEIYLPAKAANAGSPFVIYGLDGEEIDAGLRGTLTVEATGVRGLFNDGDALFVDYDRDGEMGSREGLAIDEGMMKAMSRALSIDADNSESFGPPTSAEGVGTFDVYYMPNGKDMIHHGASIKVTARVEYSDSSTNNEAPKSNNTTLNFKGVGNPVMAYAIPHSGNGTGDKGNVRVRCESGVADKDGNSMCRVFLECWDEMGMRGFDEAPMIAEDSLAVWRSTDIEAVTGLAADGSRHSCKVLSRGMVTVQQLTRDGSGTLVNNTYVGEAEM
ncbi:MAG: hypothetical protein F4Y86_16315 [Gammaproteobacteria bacterium]|nr:hypothetical protein [Gammaproteobacteria bacterium]